MPTESLLLALLLFAGHSEVRSRSSSCNRILSHGHLLLCDVVKFECSILLSGFLDTFFFFDLLFRAHGLLLHNILEVGSGCWFLLALCLVGCRQSAEHHFSLQAQFLCLTCFLLFLQFNLELALSLFFLLASLFLSFTLETLLLKLFLLVLRELSLLNNLLLGGHWLELS